MADSTIQVKDAKQVNRLMATDEVNNIHTPKHIVSRSALPDGAASENTLTEISLKVATENTLNTKTEQILEEFDKLHGGSSSRQLLATISTGNEVQLIGEAPSGTTWVITGLIVSNSSSTDTQIELRSEEGGSPIKGSYLASNGGGFTWNGRWITNNPTGKILVSVSSVLVSIDYHSEILTATTDETATST